jgi:hypothetical protein
MYRHAVKTGPNVSGFFWIRCQMPKLLCSLSTVHKSLGTSQNVKYHIFSLFLQSSYHILRLKLSDLSQRHVFPKSLSCSAPGQATPPPCLMSPAPGSNQGVCAILLRLYTSTERLKRVYTSP